MLYLGAKTARLYKQVTDIKDFQDTSYQHLDRVKRIWYLSPMRAAKVQASLRIRAVSPEPSLLAHTSSESRGTFRQKAISMAPLNAWACAVKICHDGMLEDTNSLDGAHLSKLTLEFRCHSIEFSVQQWIYHRDFRRSVLCACLFLTHFEIPSNGRNTL